MPAAFVGRGAGAGGGIGTIAEGGGEVPPLQPWKNTEQEQRKSAIVVKNPEIQRRGDVGLNDQGSAFMGRSYNTMAARRKQSGESDPSFAMSGRDIGG